MGAAVSVPTENVWCRWDVVFAGMRSTGRTTMISWEGVLAAMCGAMTIEGFQSLTGVAWCDVGVGFMEPEELDAIAQRPSHAGKDVQLPDENGERRSPNYKHTKSRRRDALPVDSMTCGRFTVNLFEKQICKRFADKLEKGWNLEEMDAPLLEPLEPRKAMEELATDFYNHMRKKPVGGAPILIKKATQTVKQSWTLLSAEECQTFRRYQEAEKVLQRMKVQKGKRPSSDKYCEGGGNVPNEGTDSGSDLTEAGL